MITSWDVLKEASSGTLNINNPYSPLQKDRKKAISLAIKLDSEGLLSRHGNSNVFYLTGKGKVALKYNSEEEYYEAINSDPSLEAITEGLDTVKKIFEGNSRTQKAVKYVSIGTGIFIALQAIFTVIQYFSPPQKNTRLELLDIVEELRKDQENRATRSDRQIDSLTTELQKLTKKVNSTSDDSVK